MSFLRNSTIITVVTGTGILLLSLSLSLQWSCQVPTSGSRGNRNIIWLLVTGANGSAMTEIDEQSVGCSRDGTMETERGIDR